MNAEQMKFEVGGDFFCRRITGVQVISLPPSNASLIQGLSKRVDHGRRVRVKPQQVWGDCRGLLSNGFHSLPSTHCGSDTEDNNNGFQTSGFQQTQSTEGSGGIQVDIIYLRRPLLRRDRSGSQVKSVWLQSNEEEKKERNTFKDGGGLE